MFSTVPGGFEVSIHSIKIEKVAVVKILREIKNCLLNNFNGFEVRFFVDFVLENVENLSLIRVPFESLLSNFHIMILWKNVRFTLTIKFFIKSTFQKVKLLLSRNFC